MMYLLLDVFKNSLGCFTVWSLYDIYNKDKKQWINYRFYKYSFFIFAFHGVPLLLFKNILKHFIPNNTVFNFGSYITIFISIVALSILQAMLMEKFFNSSYKILTGNR